MSVPQTEKLLLIAHLVHRVTDAEVELLQVAPLELFAASYARVPLILFAVVQIEIRTRLSSLLVRQVLLEPDILVLRVYRVGVSVVVA